MQLEALRQSFKQMNPDIGDEEWTFIASSFQELELGVKDFFLREGDHQPYIGFLNEGLIREYLIDEAGEEKSIRFIREHNYVTDYPTLLQGVPTSNYFMCMEPCSLILIPVERVQAAYDKYPALERFGRLIAEQVLIDLQNRIDDFQFLSAEERYLKFMKEHPDLFQRISLSHLASYLGIQRPSLSRIRKNIGR